MEIGNFASLIERFYCLFMRFWFGDCYGNALLGTFRFRRGVFERRSNSKKMELINFQPVS